MRRSFPLTALALLCLLPLVAAACRPPTSLRPEGRAPRLYRVAFGDTLSGIASAHQVPGGFLAIARANRISDPDFIEAGVKLRLDSADAALPLPAHVTAAPALSTCAMQPVNARGGSLSGCVATACVDTGRGGQVCACQAANPADDALFAVRPGAPPERLGMSGEDPWWFDAEQAPEPARSPRGLLGARAQLDADPGLETLVVWRTHLSELGMSQARALVVDDDGVLGATFRADNFGSGSLLAAGDHCDVLTTEWALTDQPGWRSWGWYLEARRFRVEPGALAPVREMQLTMRRLFDTFRPAATTFAGVRVGAPGVDLTDRRAFARSTDPGVEYTTIGVQRGTVRGARRIEGRLAVDLGGGLAEVDPAGAGVRRLGDAASGLLYPADYAPADDRSLRGRAYTARAYENDWGETWQVLWLE